ncbi:MAG: RNA methyltransferase [Bacteroidales bacterium]|nr:RNA methyltransferase [Bacteroidales bacterium]
MRKLLPDEMGRVSLEEFKKQTKMPLVVILDNVRSMNNVGSVFRTCDAFGAERLYLCGITATPPNKEISKTALGATESVDWQHVADTAVLVEQLKNDGYKIFAVEQVDTSSNLVTFPFQMGEKYAVILGNEVFGVDDKVLPLCDGALEIPQVGTKHSLNVSVTAGIVIWEVFRQLFR